MKSFLCYAIVLLFFSTVNAQESEEYRMEIGLNTGLMTYIGDFNSLIIRKMQPTIGVTANYNINPHMALNTLLMYGKIKGISTDEKTYYHKYVKSPWKFNNKLIDLSFSYQYNFFAYGTGQDYRGAKRFTPYLFGGIGISYLKYLIDEKKTAKQLFTANIPLGIGIKYKIGERTNVGLTWTIHFTLSDKLDSQSDPYGIKSTGLFKNTDNFSTLQLSLTYSFMVKCKTCHNDDE